MGIKGWFSKKKTESPPKDGKWDLSKTLKEAKGKKDKDLPKKPVKKPCAKCEAMKKKIQLVELIEVVTRGAKEGAVVNPGVEGTEKFKKIAVRKNTYKGSYKQYVNLGKDIYGANKRRAQNDQYIELRARVKWVTKDKTDSLAGRTVYFSSELTKGLDNRPAVMTGNEDHGFGSAGGKKTNYTATTDADGWTGPVKFYLSRYGGDQFKITAQADEDKAGKPSGKKLTIGKYMVWRKFWYQTTHFTGTKVCGLNQSVGAYKQVCAEMVAAAKRDVSYTKDQLNAKEANIAARTIYPEYMCVKGKESDAGRTIIGRHNEKAVRKFLSASAKEPVKMHLMFCDAQWDPAGFSSPIRKKIGHNKSQAKTTASGAVVKPALQGNLLAAGAKWYALRANGTRDNTKTGNMDDSFIEIPKKRSAQFNEITIKLPANVVKKSSGGGIEVEFQIASAGAYLGDSDGWQITIVGEGYGLAKSMVTSTVSHEEGHAFWQAPKYPDNAGSLPKSFNNAEKATLKVYQDAGWHCSNGATPWGGGIYQYGPCVIATRTDKKSRKWCGICRPFLRLQDMSTGGVKGPVR